MQITMTKTTPGSRDGCSVETFEAGSTYTFTTPHELGLAIALLELGVADEVKEAPGPDANKAQTQPETKDKGQDKTTDKNAPGGAPGAGQGHDKK